MKTEPVSVQSSRPPATEPHDESSSKTTDEGSATSETTTEHAIILDVRTRWNSLFLMVERFLEQFPAIQAASMDPRLKKSMEKDRRQRVCDEDFSKAEQFVKVTKILQPSASLLKGAQRWVDSIRQFLEEGTALDPRFKSKVADEVWTRLEEELMRRTPGQIQYQQMEHGLEERAGAGDQAHSSSDEDSASSVATLKRPKLSALEELFAMEDMAIEIRKETTVRSITEKIQAELNNYRSLPSTLSSVNSVTWWWNMKDTLPMLSDLATSFDNVCMA
ncbi:hypothetical protein PO909_029515 [Leuciscus waleckii]